jgi:aminopeptidase YwaD
MARCAQQRANPSFIADLLRLFLHWKFLHQYVKRLPIFNLFKTKFYMKYSIALCLGLLSVTAIFAQTEKEKVIETVNKSTIEGHIYFLADDLLKGRETGTPENKIAASYLANTLRASGVKPNPKTGSYYQEFQLRKVIPPTSMVLTLNNFTYKNIVAIKPASIAFKGESLFLGYGMEEDYKDVDVRGKLVVVKGGSSETKDARGAFGLRNEKLKLASEAGAKGLVEFMDVDENTWGFIDHNFNAPKLETIGGELENTDSKKVQDLSYIWVRDSKQLYANKLVRNTPMIARFGVSGAKQERVTTQNVIGVIEGTDPVLKDEYIIYSAHMIM